MSIVSPLQTKTTAAPLAPYAALYKAELLENILPFWLTHSKDTAHGGYFTCLDRDGSVYDTDKFMWLQGREVWCFAFMYQHLEKHPEWLQMAVHGAEFMERFGRDSEGNWYFSLTADGKPTRALDRFVFDQPGIAQRRFSPDAASYRLSSPVADRKASRIASALRRLRLARHK